MTLFITQCDAPNMWKPSETKNKPNQNLGKEVGIWVQLSIESSVEEPCCDRFGEGLASCQLNDFMHS